MLEREKKRGKGRKRGKKRWREGRRDQTKAELLFQHTVRRTLYIHNSDFCTIFVCGIYMYMCVHMLVCICVCAHRGQLSPSVALDLMF